jgi:hypothetical protein
MSSQGEPPSLRPKPKPDSKRGSRLPQNWTLPDVWREWAEINFSPDRAVIAREADSFRDYWISQPGQRGVKLDWEATWRNWCRKAHVPATRVQRPSAENWQDEKRRRDREFLAKHGLLEDMK